MVNDFNTALYYRVFTPFYDFLFKLFLPERKIRSSFINCLRIESGSKVIDIGCGTATLTIQLAETFSNSTLIGIDADKEILAIAGNKKQLANLQYEIGNCTQLHFKNQTIDAVVASFLFCNLSDELKQRTIIEVKRILKADGNFYITEWGKPDFFISSFGFYILQLLGGFKNTKAIRKGLLPDILKQSCFEVRHFDKINTLLGSVYFYEAKNLS